MMFVWECVNLCGLFESFGDEINHWRWIIYISTPDTPLEARNFSEMTLCVFNSTAGWWQLSSTVHGKAFGCTHARGQRRHGGQLFSLNQHLFYLPMIWFGLHGNCSGFFSWRWIHWRWCSTSCLRSRDFWELMHNMYGLLCMGGRGGWKRKALVSRFSVKFLTIYTQIHMLCSPS